MAAAYKEAARLTVIELEAETKLVVYQISVVFPLALVDCTARVQVAPVCVIPLTLLAVVPLVFIIATSVLPFVGERETPMLLAPEPVFPVAD